MMPKVKYNDIVFDSELEVEYYKHLHELMDKDIVVKFEYHPKHPIHINTKNTYTPDFIVEYDDRIEVVETKGFNQFSYMRDNIIHNFMQSLTKNDLKQYINYNGWNDKNKDVLYKKVKYLKAFGWVDFDFKNPNTLANKRKQKIDELKEQVKELSKFKKDCERYFSYEAKIKDSKKLTKSQQEWFDNYTKLNIDKYIVIIK